jgi:hypothetical protein
MAVFKDSEGREWELRLTVGALRAVRERTGVELGKVIASEKGIAELLFGNPETFATVLWVLIEKQVLNYRDKDGKGISEQDLAESLDGPTNERVVEAMMGAIADFSPRSSIGKAIKERLPKLLERMDQSLTTEVNRMMDETEQKLTLREMVLPKANHSTLSGSAGS